MSAFVVSHDHIDAILTFVRYENRDLLERLGHYANLGAAADLTDIGRVLLMECERSVKSRYPDCDDDDLPGKIGETSSTYYFKTFEPLLSMPQGKKVAWIVKACKCFDYQSCETDDYEQSVAHRIIRAIEARAMAALPHYEDAPWEINRERVA